MNNNEVQNRGLDEDVFDFILKRYTKPIAMRPWVFNLSTCPGRLL